MNELNDKELKIVKMIAEGMIAKEIGARMFLSGRTVETYIAEIKERFEAKTQAHLVSIMYQKGILKVNC